MNNSIKRCSRRELLRVCVMVAGASNGRRGDRSLSMCRCHTIFFPLAAAAAAAALCGIAFTHCRIYSDEPCIIYGALVTGTRERGAFFIIAPTMWQSFHRASLSRSALFCPKRVFFFHFLVTFLVLIGRPSIVDTCIRYTPGRSRYRTV